MIRVPKENNAADHSACGANASPNGIGGSNWDAFHGLGHRKEAEHNKDDRDDAWNKTREALAKFKGDREANFKKSGQ